MLLIILLKEILKIMLWAMRSHRGMLSHCMAVFIRYGCVTNGLKPWQVNTADISDPIISMGQ